MFEIHTTEPARLKWIVVGGTSGLLVGLVLVTINLALPILTGAGVDPANVVFGALGIFVVVLGTHPTYQAAQKLDESG
jgi:hypothetical protein